LSLSNAGISWIANLSTDRKFLQTNFPNPNLIFKSILIQTTGTNPTNTNEQARNQRGCKGGEVPLGNFSYPLKKCVVHNLKILDTVQNIWAPLGKLFAPPGVLSSNEPGNNGDVQRFNVVLQKAAQGTDKLSVESQFITQ